MSAPAIMPFYVAEYLADTGHLTRDEHGAYMLLIMHYWQNGGLPDDPRKLAQITRSASVEDWSSIASTISACFKPGWRHKRIDAELAKAQNKHEKRRNAGKIGGLTKASNASFLLKQKSSNASQTPPILYTDEVLHLDSVLEQEPNKLASTRDKPPVAKRATRIPANFQCDLDEAERLGLSRRDAEREAAAFADYWKAKPKDATKLDWQATWRNWCRRVIERKGGSDGQFRSEQGVIVKPAVISESPTRAAARIARRGG
jgi:uncharacterized protein YdaU (DUF1376 family)